MVYYCCCYGSLNHSIIAKELLQPIGDFIEIGTARYPLTQEAQQFFDGSYSSNYPKDTSVVVIGEPHESSEGQFNLFKGLEAFFAGNPSLVPQTIFLSEGTVANKPISIQELIDEEPHPSDDIIRQVLQSHLITGYMAYEWKHQHGIPIIGTEDEGLYELSRRFASLCRENPNAVFIHRKYTDGTGYDIPLTYAWSFAVAARNKRIAQALVEQVGKYTNPMLFVAWDHINDQRHGFEKKWDSLIKKIFIDAQYMSVYGVLQFPWATAGENWWLYRNVHEDTEISDIHYFLMKERIGYTFLSPKGSATPEDTRNYGQIFKAQRK